MDMERVFCKPDTLNDFVLGYCPGCGHGTSTRLIAEVIEEMGVRQRTVAIIGSGCYGNSRQAFDFSVVHALHGRAPAVATGLKRTHPNLVVFTLQGDGDFAAIGTADAIHAGMRGEKFTTIFLNNANFGMTGGQWAPTTLPGQKTTTTPKGHDPLMWGFPSRMTEMMALADGTAYVARVAINNPQNVNRAKRAIRRAFEVQMQGLGYSIVEILTPCPSGWRLKPLESLRWMEEQQMQVYPLKEYKVPAEKVEKAA